MVQSSKQKHIFCSNKECRRLLAQTDGTKIEPVNKSVLSNKMSDTKKKFNPLYCVHCHQITRVYKKKYQSKIKKEKYLNNLKIGKAGK